MTVMTEAPVVTGVKNRTKELTRNLGNGMSLWKTSDSHYTHGLRDYVLGWGKMDNDLDFGINTEHLIITSFNRGIETSSVTYEEDVSVEIKKPATPLGDAGIPSNSSLEYHMENDNAHIISASSFGYQKFPSDDEELIESGIITSPLFHAGVPDLRFYAVSVHPTFQHQGLGLMVMNHIQYQARKSNAGILWAYARESALRFYTDTLDFKKVGEWFKDTNTNEWAVKIAAKI